ncbi:MAG: 30S ribosomal protein S16, partial [Actinomycetia bacterium]|nr:30S ribosomal protein S16 [Actinomycetes bacterium]
VKIKLKRIGKIRVPQYRIVVADARTARGGRAIEELGIYQPKQNPSLIRVDSDRVQYWLSVGAQPTEPVMAILKVTGDWQKFKGLPGAEGTLQQPEAKSDQTEIFNQAAKDAVVEKDRVSEARAAAAKKAAKERAEGEKAEKAAAEKAAEEKAKASKKKPAEEKAEASAEKPAEEKAEASAEKPAEEKAEASAEKPAEEKAEASAEKPAEEKAGE